MFLFEASNTLKLLVQMDKLLLLNRHDCHDVHVIFCEEKAPKMVVSICKQNPEGIRLSKFRKILSDKLGVSLKGCNIVDFLKRWRFLTIKEKTKRNEAIIYFRPHCGATVFIGNLRSGVTKAEIYEDLVRVNPAWAQAEVRIKLSKGASYAFVDFNSHDDALKAVRSFDGTCSFGSRYVTADLEAVDRKKTRDVSTVYIGNMDDNTTKANVYEILRTKGGLDTSKLAVRINQRGGWTHAFVDLPCPKEARDLIKALRGKKTLGSSCLRVELAKNGI